MFVADVVAECMCARREHDGHAVRPVKITVNGINNVKVYYFVFLSVFYCFFFCLLYQLKPILGVFSASSIRHRVILIGLTSVVFFSSTIPLRFDDTLHVRCLLMWRPLSISKCTSCVPVLLFRNDRDIFRLDAFFGVSHNLSLWINCILRANAKHKNRLFNAGNTPDSGARLEYVTMQFIVIQFASTYAFNIYSPISRLISMSYLHETVLVKSPIRPFYYFIRCYTYQ